jgi:hypothetical protein
MLPSIPFADQQVLDQQVAGGEKHAPTLLDQDFADGEQEMGLAALWATKPDPVLRPIAEGAFHQHAQVGIDFVLRPSSVEAVYDLLRWQARIRQ